MASASSSPDPSGAAFEAEVFPWGRGLVLLWVVFWLLMFLVGVQEEWRNGGRGIFRPSVDYATSAAVATAVAVLQLRRARHADALLNTPLRWFAHLWSWVPLIAPAYVAATYALRHAIFFLAGMSYSHGPWSEVARYEIVKFLLFYALFSGVHFGLRSYAAWNAERLRGEYLARLTQEARVAQLTQQIQPHFLFNALNTVSSLIHSDAPLADALLTRLAVLLRAATEASQQPQHSLGDELVLLESYVVIMSERFAGRVQVKWQIDAEARACRVPTLGLQPLLENCFQHVVEHRRQCTGIVVRARREDDAGGRLVVEIENDGELPSHAPSPGVGLGNLRQRLATLYGADAVLTLSSQPPGKTTARVELPCVC
ncbi:MAG TPA: histidine kinase [Caldimonas sp.]|jgi:hypothetical protein|nr:histidine kinase [Caldimonas sp.]HEX4235487.1 histidine kinase [Caldimonas sp.]